MDTQHIQRRALWVLGTLLSLISWRSAYGHYGLRTELPPDFSAFLSAMALVWGGVGSFALLSVLLATSSRGWRILHARAQTPAGRWLLGLAALGVAIIALINGFVVLGMQASEPALFWIGGIVSMVPLYVLALSPALGARLLLATASVVFFVGVLEVAAQLYVRADPVMTYQTNYPHPRLGWTLARNTAFEHTWEDATCRDFRVDVTTNQHGMFDRDHTRAKPADTLRIVMLGDSFVQGLQVPYAARASHVLERELNARQDLPGNPRFEVLNFGVNSYSTGQAYLLYREIARHYQPDYVFLLVSEYLMDRTLNNTSVQYLFTDYEGLVPRFALTEAGSLHIQPPRGVAEIRAAIAPRFDPQGDPLPQEIGAYHPNLAFGLSYAFAEAPYAHLRDQSMFIRFLSHRLDTLWLAQMQHWFGYQPPNRWAAFQRSEAHRAVNFGLIRRLHEATAQDNAQLVILDDTRSVGMPSALGQFLGQINVPFVNVRDPLLTVVAQGKDVRYLCDAHYNERGHQVIAEEALAWISADLTAPREIFDNPSFVVFDQRDGEWHVYRYADGQGVFVAGFRPDALPPEDQLFAADDGWAVVLHYQEDGRYHLALRDPNGAVSDVRYTFRAL